MARNDDSSHQGQSGAPRASGLRVRPPVDALPSRAPRAIIEIERERPRRGIVVRPLEERARQANRLDGPRCDVLRRDGRVCEASPLADEDPPRCHQGHTAPARTNARAVHTSPVGRPGLYAAGVGYIISPVRRSMAALRASSMAIDCWTASRHAETICDTEHWLPCPSRRCAWLGRTGTRAGESARDRGGDADVTALHGRERRAVGLRQQRARSMARRDRFSDEQRASAGSLLRFRSVGSAGDDRARAFLARLVERKIDPARIGCLPYAILENYGRLRSALRQYRRARAFEDRDTAAANAVFYAGTLGHYVADGTMPMHLSIHFNGWARDAPNPRKFTQNRKFHARYENAYVNAALDDADVRAGVQRPKRLPDVFQAVRGHLVRTFAELEPMHELEKIGEFDPASPQPRGTRFIAGELARATTLLADLWLTAWIESGESASEVHRP